jgi:DNA primase
VDVVQEIKARVPIEEVVGEYVDLRRSGASYKGLCPFHVEKTPSFYVSPARGTFHCFGCGQGGDVLSFVQAIEKLEFRDALRKLAERAGIQLEDRVTQQEEVTLHKRLYAANAMASEFFRDRLRSSIGERARLYLAQRQLSAEVQLAFSLGYAPATRAALLDHLRQCGIEDEILVQAGLVLADDAGRPVRDRFHDRLMFPIRDAQGRVTGFGGRIIDSGKPKYLNSPQTPIFDKSRTLFAIDLAQRTIRQQKRAIVVEGYIDAVRAHDAGFHDVVATLGTAVTTTQVQMLARLAPTIIIALDPDPAGQLAAARAALSALAALPRRQQQLPDSLGRHMVDIGLSIDLRIARIPPDAGDPDELILRDSTLWQEVITASVPAFEFYFDLVAQSLDRSDPNWRQQAVDRIMPVVREFSFAIGTQAAWIERLAELTGIEPRLLQSTLPRSPQPSIGRRTRQAKHEPAGPPPSPSRSDPRREAERSLLQILLRVPVPVEVIPALRELRFTGETETALLQAILAQADSGLLPDLEREPENVRQLAQELREAPGGMVDEGHVTPAIRLHIATLRLHDNRQQTTELQQLLSEIEAEDQSAVRRQLELLLEERYVLEQQITELQRQVIASG